MDASEVPEYDLQMAAIKSVFGGLPLEKKRRLIGEFLDMSQVWVLESALYYVPKLDPTFLKWICTSRKGEEQLSHDEISEIFLIWTHVQKCAGSGAIIYSESGDDYDYTCYISVSEDLAPMYRNRKGFSRSDMDGNAYSMTKKKFFDHILESGTPWSTVLLTTDNEDGLLYLGGLTFCWTSKTIYSPGWQNASVQSLIKRGWVEKSSI